MMTRKRNREIDTEKNAPLSLLFTEQFKDIFDQYVVQKLSSKTDLKFFYGTNRASRRAIKRNGIRLEKKFDISEFTTCSQVSFAFDNYKFGENGYKGTEEWFSMRVARTNKLELLKFLREVKKCEWNSWTVNNASQKGNLEMTKYCVEMGCPLDEDVCSAAAAHGNLDCLIYLREKECPWNANILQLANKYGHSDCLNYLIENKCPGFERFLPSTL